MKMLLKNARLLEDHLPQGTQKDDIFHLVVTEETITYIGTVLPEDTFDRVIDCKENL